MLYELGIASHTKIHKKANYEADLVRPPNIPVGTFSAPIKDYQGPCYGFLCRFHV